MKNSIKFGISEDYYDLLKSEKNEEIVLSILKDSTKIFTGIYIHNLSQPNGESDFVEDIDNSRREIDTKVLFLSEMCRYVEDHDIDGFIKKMEDIQGEIFDSAIKSGYESIPNCRLYKDMVRLLQRNSKQAIKYNKKKEDIIFIFPFPISHKNANYLVCNHSSDNIEIIFNKVQKDYPELVKDINVYLITSGEDLNTIIYSLQSDRVCYEFMNKNYFDKYIIGIKNLYTN